VANASGAGSFTSAALTAANNGQTLQITGVTTTSTTPNCSAAFTQNVTLSVRPTPTLTGASQSAAVCPGSGALISLTGLLASSTSTINYSINGVAQTAITGVVANASGAGSFTSAALTAANNNQTLQITGVTTTSATPNCPAAFTQNVILSVNPNLTASVSIIASPSVTICSGTSVTFTASPINGGTGPTYQWYKGGVLIPSETASTYTTTTLTNSDVITVSMTSNATPCLTGSPTTSNSLVMIVNPNPSIPTVGTITNVSCSAGGSVVLNGLPSGSWTINQSGTAITSYSSNTSSYTVLGLAVGSYTFTVTNASGCPSSATGPVSITDASSTTWNGIAWSNGTPDATKNAIITSVTPNSPFTADLSACALTINNSSGVVTIPSGITLTIINGITVSTDYNLIFENNASLVQINNATNIGKIIYKRNSAPMKNFDYTYWSSPVAGQTLFNLSPNTLADKYMSYSGTGWQVLMGGTAVMQPGIGYIIRTPKGGTWPAPYPEVVVFPYSQPVQFKGVPNNGNITSSQSMLSDKFYLIGNPYPSALNADDFLFNNTNNHNVLNGTIYLWTHNTAVTNLKYSSDDYASYNLTGGTATTGTNNAEPSGYIAAGQSFFASAKTNGTVEFNNSMRANGSNGNNAQFFKPGKTAKTGKLEKHRLWLNMTNTTGAFKQTLIGYAEGATNNFDNDFDGLTFDGNSYLDLYSINGTDNLTIQGRALPFTDTDLVPLGYRSTVAGSFTIAINQADGALANQRIYLEDKQTNTINDLTAQNYTFSTTVGTFNNRFVLRYTNKTLGTGDFENVENSVTVTSQDKTIVISSPTENIDKVFIYDISGKQLYKKQSVGNVELSIQHLPFVQQVLLVKIVLENGYTITKKMIFK
ncbi:MAG: T9SS sorting signal type C domain-containing protein, partial [Flavobacterium sp.]